MSERNREDTIVRSSSAEPERLSNALPVGIVPKPTIIDGDKITPEGEAILMAQVGGGSFDEEPYDLDTLRLLVRDMGHLPQRAAEWLIEEYPKRQREVIALQSECQDREEEAGRLSCQLEGCRAQIRSLNRELERVNGNARLERERIETAAREVC